MPLDQTGTGRSLSRSAARPRRAGPPDDLLAHLRCDPDDRARSRGLAGAPDPPRRVRDGRRARRRAGRPRPATWPGSRSARSPAARLAALAAVGPGHRRGRPPRRAPLAGSGAAELGASPGRPARAAGRRRGRGAARRARRGRRRSRASSHPTSATPSRRIEGASVPAWRGPGRRPHPDRQPVPRARRARPLPVLRLAAGRRVSGARRRSTRCSAPSAGPRWGSRRCAAAIPPERGALPLPRLRLAAPRAPLPELALLRTRTAPRLPARRSWTRCSTFWLRARRTRRGAASSVVRGPERVVPSAPRRPRTRAGAVPARSQRSGPRCARDPCANPVVARRARRTATRVSANSLEGWIGCSYRWFVDHELRPVRLEPEADPLWLGSIVHEALERLYREAPGRGRDPAPRRRRALEGSASASCSTELSAESAPARRAPRRRSPACGCRSRPSSTRRRRQRDGPAPAAGPARVELRPRRATSSIPSSWASSACTASSTASTSRPTGRAPWSATTRRPRRCSGAGAFEKNGLLQLPLYMRAVSGHPEARPDRRPLPPARPPTATASRAASRAARTSGWRASALSRRTKDVLRRRGIRRAARRGGGAGGGGSPADAGGDIKRDPLGRQLPEVLRATSRSAGSSGRSASTPRRARRRSERGRDDHSGGRRRLGSHARAARRRSRRAIATSSARPAPAAARRGSSSTATAKRSPTTASRSSAILAFTFTERAARRAPRAGPRGAHAPLARRRRRRARARELATLARATERSWVMTIHAFCRRLLAAHPLAAGLDPRFRVLDEAEAGRLRERAIADALASVTDGADRGRRPRARRLPAVATRRHGGRPPRAPAKPGHGLPAPARACPTRSAPRKPDDEETAALSPAEARGRARRAGCPRGARRGVRQPLLAR